MNQKFIHQNNNKSLSLIFLGWSMQDLPLASDFESHNDLAIIYGYQDLDFDPSPYQNYQQINLIGYSLGVYMMALVQKLYPFAYHQAIAINGTPLPIHTDFGIAPTLYQNTLEHLNPQNFKKFCLRMYGGNSEAFLQSPKWTLYDSPLLQKELAQIAHYTQIYPQVELNWTQAYISQNDLIFRAKSQKAFWESQNIIPQIQEGPHWPDWSQIKEIYE